MPVRIKEDFGNKVDLFKKHPFDSRLGTHKLQGNLSAYYAFCLCNGYRVLFEFEDTNNVLLVNIGGHDDYSKWAKG